MDDVASEMLNAQKYLEIVRKRGEANAELKRVDRNIRQRGLFFAAYGKLYSNEGATTPGVDPDDTVDGMSLQKIDTILNNTAHIISPMRPATPCCLFDISIIPLSNNTFLYFTGNTM